VVGTYKENGSGSDAKKDDGRKTVYRTNKRKTSFEMDEWMDDVVTDLKVMKITQWIEKTKERERDSSGYLLLRPRLTQGCSAKRNRRNNKTEI
jgi:hypothetical protein